ncbi:MAG: DUF3108 domain-containing protein [Acidobacteriota bacterium]|nr:DUF3108 domain-containing protein [Acidobacteriota bacterium]
MRNSLFISLAIAVLGFFAVFAQEVPKPLSPATAATVAPFRTGERLSYSVSFGKITDAAYAEIFVVSRGKLAGRDAVELQGKFKTTNLVSAFYLLDEIRQSYASAETGLPLYTRIVSNEGILPKETAKNFVENPTAYHDLLTAIYHARNINGTGGVSFQENDRIYNALFQTIGTEKVKTDAGEFETSVSTVQSTFLDEAGLRDFRINFSNDEARLPVLIRFKTLKGEFRAALASVQTILPVDAQVEPTPVLAPPTPTPLPVQTPRPTPVATPYIENQPLPQELPFDLGETLNFRVTSQNQNIGTVTLQAKERKLSAGRDGVGRDSLLLTATVTASGQQRGILNVGDVIRSTVDPVSLAPMNIEMRLTGALSPYNQVVQFEQSGGFALDNVGSRIEMPVGTHSLLSLAYAIRSFSLMASKNPTNPVNDTRVALFVGDRPYVLILRPSTIEIIEFQGRRLPAQVVAITTGNPQIDRLNLKIWLSVDERRLPLRFVVGAYQADLQSVIQTPVIR